MHAWFDIHSTLGMFPDFSDYSQSEQNVNMLEWEMFGHSLHSRAIGNEGDTENGGVLEKYKNVSVKIKVSELFS